MESTRPAVGSTTETENSYTLRLEPPQRGVTWSEEVVDNEHMDKKKSKSELYSSMLYF